MPRQTSPSGGIAAAGWKAASRIGRTARFTVPELSGHLELGSLLRTAQREDLLDRLQRAAVALLIATVRLRAAEFQSARRLIGGAEEDVEGRAHPLEQVAELEEAAAPRSGRRRSADRAKVVPQALRREGEPVVFEKPDGVPEERFDVSCLGHRILRVVRSTTVLTVIDVFPA